jgi:hypothetical protein
LEEDEPRKVGGHLSGSSHIRRKRVEQGVAESTSGLHRGQREDRPLLAALVVRGHQGGSSEPAEEGARLPSEENCFVLITVAQKVVQKKKTREKSCSLSNKKVMVQRKNLNVTFQNVHKLLLLLKRPRLLIIFIISRTFDF